MIYLNLNLYFNCLLLKNINQKYYDYIVTRIALIIEAAFDLIGCLGCSDAHRMGTVFRLWKISSLEKP